MSTERRDPRSMTQFGVFYPRGYIVAALDNREDAERVRAMNVVRRLPLKFAHQYHRLAIEVLE